MNNTTRYIIGFVIIMAIATILHIANAEEKKPQLIENSAQYYMFMLTGDGKAYIPEMYKIVKEYRFGRPKQQIEPKTKIQE